MNWANRITLSRLVLTVLFVLALNSSWNYARTAALIIFLLAGVSDFVDGEIARRYGSITNFGKLMDPLVDKIMASLEGWNFTIKLCPQLRRKLPRAGISAKSFLLCRNQPNRSRAKVSDVCRKSIWPKSTSDRVAAPHNTSTLLP